MRRRFRVYREPKDWWMGVYLGPEHVYVCPLPTLVIRFDRAAAREEGQHGE